MRKAQLTISIVLLALFLVACGPQAAPAPAAQVPAAAAPAPAVAPAPAPAAAAPAKAAWQVEMDNTIAAAKREGTVVLYTTLGGEGRMVVTEPFQTKYGIRVESVTGGSGLVAPKLAAEQRAGIYSGDVWLGGSTTYRELPGLLGSLDSALILPELIEPELIKKTWYFGEVPWANKEHTTLIGLMVLQEYMATNTDLVKPGEIAAYRSLLDPKWKGKISLNDPRVGGSGSMWFAVAMEMGDVDVNFLRTLVTEQQVFITRDRRLQAEWLARGKHAIAVAPHPATFAEFIQLGAPVVQFSVGTPFISGSSSGISMMVRQPHPNAARLYVNWFLSQEGQTFNSRAVGGQSQRLDVPTSHLPPAKVLKPGLKVFKSDSEEFAAKRVNTYTPLAQEVFDPLAK